MYDSAHTHNALHMQQGTPQDCRLLTSFLHRTKLAPPPAHRHTHTSPSHPFHRTRLPRPLRAGRLIHQLTSFLHFAESPSLYIPNPRRTRCAAPAPPHPTRSIPDPSTRAEDAAPRLPRPARNCETTCRSHTTPLGLCVGGGGGGGASSNSNRRRRRTPFHSIILITYSTSDRS